MQSLIHVVVALLALITLQASSTCAAPFDANGISTEYGLVGSGNDVCASNNQSCQLGYCCNFGGYCGKNTTTNYCGEGCDEEFTPMNGCLANSGAGPSPSSPSMESPSESTISTKTTVTQPSQNTTTTAAFSVSTMLPGAVLTSQDTSAHMSIVTLTTIVSLTVTGSPESTLPPQTLVSTESSPFNESTWTGYSAWTSQWGSLPPPVGVTTTTTAGFTDSITFTTTASSTKNARMS